MTIRPIRFIAIALASVLLLAGCGGQTNTPTPSDKPADSATPAKSEDAKADEPKADTDTPLHVNVGYIPDYNGCSLMAIANDKDLWKKHGLDVKLSNFTNGPLQIQALGTKDLDFGYIGVGAMWLPASGQAKVVAINSLGLADRVIAQPGIKSIKDLKGKKVGVPEGTSGDMILSLALEANGMTEADIDRIPMDPSTVVAAFASGQIDAAGIWYPHVQTLQDKVKGMTMLAKSSDFADKLQFPSATVMRAGLDKENPELAKRMVGVLRDAMDIRAADQDYAVNITSAFMNTEPDKITTEVSFAEYKTAEETDKLTKDGTIDTWLDNLATFYEKMGKIPAGKKVPAKDFYLGDVFVGK